MEKKSIFISYAHEDKHHALKLYKNLSGFKLKPWLDSESLLPGQNWRYEIEKAIRHSDFFIAILSNKSVSKRGYVQKELKIALDVLDEFPATKIYIIPIRINECEIIEPKLKFIHYIDLFPEWEFGVDRIIKSIIPSEDIKKSEGFFLKLKIDDVNSHLTQLEYAIGTGDVSLAEDLLKRGANPNYPLYSYGSPLGYALFETFDAQVRYSLTKTLLSYGADISAVSSHDASLLSYITFTNDIATAKLLIEKGIDVNKPDNKGFTPLMGATNYQAIEMTKILLNSGVDINAVDENGCSALIYSVLYYTDSQFFYTDNSGNELIENDPEEEKKCLEIVNLLINAGAKYSHRNNSGKSAFDYAHDLQLKLVEERLSKKPNG